MSQSNNSVSATPPKGHVAEYEAKTQKLKEDKRAFRKTISKVSMHLAKIIVPVFILGIILAVSGEYWLKTLSYAAQQSGLQENKEAVNTFGYAIKYILAYAIKDVGLGLIVSTVAVWGVEVAGELSGLVEQKQLLTEKYKDLGEATHALQTLNNNEEIRTLVSSEFSELKSMVEESLQASAMKRFGVDEIIAGTPYSKIYEEIELSKEFTLLQTWSPDMKNLLDSCESVLTSGGMVTIFLLHPASFSAKQRSIDLKEKLDNVPGKIRSDTAQVRSMYKRLIASRNVKAPDLKKRLRLFYYSTLPAFALYKTDRKAWVSFYWHGKQSDWGMNLVIDFHSDNQAKKYYEKHLASLRSVAQEVTLDSEEEPVFQASF
jgi:hypothetical protein